MTAARHRARAHRRFLYLVVALMIWIHGDVAPPGSAGAAAGGSPGAAAGDAARGESLFARLPCASCHDITSPSPGGVICPNLGSIGAEAARRIRLPEYHGKAKDAAGYIRESIVDPNAFVVPGPNYRTADGQSIMPKTFAATLKPSELDDLVAFLLTRR